MIVEKFNGFALTFTKNLVMLQQSLFSETGVVLLGRSHSRQIMLYKKSFGGKMYSSLVDVQIAPIFLKN